jgi:hypothetical protein
MRLDVIRKHWSRAALGGVAAYVLCWAATWYWGTAAARASQANRLQAEIDKMPPLIHGLTPPSTPPFRPTYREADPSTPVPFVVDVKYSMPSRGGRARWMWLPWGVYLLDDKTTWVE